MVNVRMYVEVMVIVADRETNGKMNVHLICILLLPRTSTHASYTRIFKVRIINYTCMGTGHNLLTIPEYASSSNFE